MDVLKFLPFLSISSTSLYVITVILGCLTVSDILGVVIQAAQSSVGNTLLN